MEENQPQFPQHAMNTRSFDLAVLRTFVLGVDLGTFAKAAQVTFRSASAVSAQIKNLERLLGVALTHKVGRGIALTPAGEILIGYARRMLELNDHALRAIEQASEQTAIGVGIIEDLTGTVLPIVLHDLRSRHPDTSIQVRIGRHEELVRELEQGKIQLFIGWEDSASLTRSQRLSTHPLKWIGNKELAAAARSNRGPIPLVFLSGRCPLRTQGTRALTAAGIPWKVACTSSSLDGVWAAVRAGIGITVRCELGLSPDLAVLDGFPQLPEIGVAIHAAHGPWEEWARDLPDYLACGMPK